jgi:hypothetical protein
LHRRIRKLCAGIDAGIFNACQDDAPRACATDAARMKQAGRVIDRLTFPPNVAAA